MQNEFVINFDSGMKISGIRLPVILAALTGSLFLCIPVSSNQSRQYGSPLSIPQLTAMWIPGTGSKNHFVQIQLKEKI